MRYTAAALRWIALACALALAWFALPGAPAEGGNVPRDLLEVDFSVNPGEMVAPGDVTMTFLLSNPSEFDIQNIYLSSPDGLISEPIGQIGAGETQTLVRPHTVTEEELEDGAVRYIISHDPVAPGGEKVSRMLSAYIVRGSARPDVDFTQQLSSRSVVAGGQLTVTYKLTNNGNVPVTDVQVQDALGDFTGRLEQLDIGATRTFISRVTIGAETESEASLEYSVPSGERVTRKLDPVPIRLSESALESEFSIALSAFDAGRADAVTLPSGGNPREISCTYPVRGDGEYRWRVTGSSQSGEALDFVTETLTLQGGGAPREISVALSAKTRMTKINRAGCVTFNLELRNTGTAIARGIRLYEVHRGDIRDLAVLPTGEPMQCSVTYEVDEDAQFVFCADYQDADGHARTATSAPVNVEITPAGVAPEPKPGESARLRGGSIKLGTSRTFTILLLVASAALVSMFTILLVTSLRARQERRRRIAAQRQRAAARKTGASGKTGKTGAVTAVQGDARPRRKREKK